MHVTFLTQIDGLRIHSSIRMFDIMDTSDHFRRLELAIDIVDMLSRLSS